MRPVIDILFTDWPTSPGGDPVALVYMKHFYQMGSQWPEKVSREKCLTLDCMSLAEVKFEVQRLKDELDACVLKAERQYRKSKAVA